MSKGRNTTQFSVRVPDNILVAFKAKAAKKGIPFTVFVRYLIRKELGLLGEGHEPAISIKRPTPLTRYKNPRFRVRH